MKFAFENATNLIFISTLSVLGIASISVPQRSINDVELRPKAPFPSFNLSVPNSLNMRNLKTFPQEFDQFFNDRIALRNQTIALRNLLKLNVWNVSGAKNVLTGKKQYLFLEDDVNQGRPEKVNPYEQAELNEVTEKYLAPYKQLKRRGIAYLLVVVPGKSASCSSFLQADLAMNWKRVRMDQVLQKLSAEGMPVLDLTDYLSSKDDNPNYYKRDTHWNTRGALIASKAVEEKLSKEFPAMTVIRKAGVQQTAAVKKTADLARMLAISSFITEESNELSVQLKDKKMTSSNNGLHLAGSPSSKGDEGLPKAIFFCDSFGLYMLRFLQHSFDGLSCYEEPYVRDDLVQKLKPKVVIHEVADRFFAYPK